MFIKSTNPITKEIIVSIPLTSTSGKTRIKTRISDFEYGIPFAPKQNNFSLLNYVEWQIGYDSVLDDPKKIVLTTLKDINFQSYNGKTKAFYELSEYLYYFAKWQVFGRQELLDIVDFLNNIAEPDLIEKNSNCQIKRTHPQNTKINQVDFIESKVEYPLLVHRFEAGSIMAEIIIKEKQRAVGTQAMLYFCFSIVELQSTPILIGRPAKTKEHSYFVFDQTNCQIILKLIKIFGMLSVSHRTDIIAIINTTIDQLDIPQSKTVEPENNSLFEKIQTV